MSCTKVALSFVVLMVFSAPLYAANSATFIATDAATKGNWKGVYGGDGYIMPGNGATQNYQHLPSYATVTATGKSDFTFAASTADVRGLLKPGNNTDRFNGCWFADTTFDVDVAITANRTRRIALYCCDWDSAARAQRIDVLDAANLATVLSTQTIPASFNGGVWLTWDITGSVKFRFTDVGSPNTVLNGIFFGGTSFGPSVDTVWFDDATPPGAVQQGDYAWNFVSSNPAPFSGALAHQSSIAGGTHQHYFTGATTLFRINKGDRLIAHVYLDPANVPSEIMLQWNDGGWEHRAHWGGNGIPFGADLTVARRYMGPLPPAGQWVRLEVPAGLVGLEGRDLNGIAFTIFDGRATWDRPGKTTPATLAITPPTPSVLTSGTQAFTTTLVDIDGAPLTPQTPVAFSATGGTIDTSGNFTAGLVPGTYTVTAFTSTSTATATSSITVNSRPPVAVADSFRVTMSRTRTVAALGVLANDTDPEGEALTAILDTNPTNGTLVLNANGSYTYTPTANYIGADTFTYHARDPFGNNSAPVSVTITVEANQTPVITTSVNQFTQEERPYVGSMSATDGNGDPIIFVLVTPPTKGVVTITNPAVGSYFYTPNVDATGTDTFVLGAQDDSGATGTIAVTVMLLPVNDPPVANNGALQTGNNQSRQGTLTGSDVDSTTLTFAIFSPPAHGTVVLNSAATGAYTYTPFADYVGNDSFTFISSDGALTSAPGTILVVVTPGPQFASLPTLTPNPVVAGQATLASASAPGAVSMTWDWGDGTTGAGTSLQHSWSISGVYTVKVTVVGADGVATVVTTQVLVAASLEGTGGGGGGGGAQPGVVGILIGGSGSGSANGKGKITCNYVKREKTMYSGTLSGIAFPSSLKQEDLIGLPGTLKLGVTNPSMFRFDLNAKGKGKSTGLPQVELSLKKKMFRFKAQRSDLTELTEALGGPREFSAGKNVTLLVPATVQIGNKVVLAMTFQVNYKQISNGGVGTLSK